MFYSDIFVTSSENCDEKSLNLSRLMKNNQNFDQPVVHDTYFSLLPTSSSKIL